VAGEGTTPVAIVGEIGQGVRLGPSDATADLPSSLIEEHEQVYRVTDGSLRAFEMARGDLLFVEPKRKAHTGELVIAQLKDAVFVGRFWAKHGRRDLMSGDGQRVIAQNAGRRHRFTGGNRRACGQRSRRSPRPVSHRSAFKAQDRETFPSRTRQLRIIASRRLLHRRGRRRACARLAGGPPPARGTRDRPCACSA
jgi:Peptidase S24-like